MKTLNKKKKTCKGEIFTPKSELNSRALLDSLNPPPITTKKPRNLKQLIN